MVLSDFICTNSVAYYIRDGKLNCSVSMRSNDVIYGYKNDYAWQQFVLYELAEELSQPHAETGENDIGKYRTCMYMKNILI